MARGINKVILIGNLGNDPETRYTAQGSAITNLSVATDESYKDKNTGQIVPKTEWHRVVLFNRLAEIAKEYLKKGSKVYLEGRLQTQKWQDKATGQDRYTTEIVANEMQMLDSRGGFDQPQQGGYSAPAQQSQQPQQQGTYSQQAPQQNAPQQNAPAPRQAPQQQQSAPAQQQGSYAPQNAPQQGGYGQQQAPQQAPQQAAPVDDFDDDIPF